MRYWLTLVITGTVLFALTFLLGLSVIGINIVGPEGGGHKEEVAATSHDSEATHPGSQHEEGAAVVNPEPGETVNNAGQLQEKEETGGSAGTGKKLPGETAPGSDKVDQPAKPNVGKKPAAKKVSFQFTLKEAGFITVKVLNEDGKTLATPFKDKPLTKGKQTLSWEANINGRPLQEGTYRYVVESNNRGVPVLLYHEISEAREVNPYTESIADFRRQMKYLKENGYKTLTTSQLVQYMQDGASIPEKAVVITFEDGYASAYSRVLPVLENYNFHALLFVRGSFIDSSEKLTPAPLTWAQIRDLARSGVFEIGSDAYEPDALHQKTGESVSQYKTRVEKDLTKVTAKISTVIGENTAAISWPGRPPAQAVSIARKQGYRYFFTVGKQQNFFGDSVGDIKRQLISSGIGLAGFTRIVAISSKSAVVKQATFEI